MTAERRDKSQATIGALLGAVGYVIALIVIMLLAKAPTFWHDLLTTSRSRNGFIVYSLVYVLPAISFALLLKWNTEGRARIWIRRVLVILLPLLMAAAALFLVVFALSWDWKMRA